MGLGEQASDSETSARKASELRDNVERRRFELPVGEHVAFVEYWRVGKRLHLMHTEVPAALQGRGAGSRLIQAVLERARAEGAEIVPNCPFVKAYLAKHPEYQPLVHVLRAPI